MMRRSSFSRPTNAVAGAPAGRSSDTTRYAAVVSLLLEPRRDVERITEAGAVLVADDDLAGVDRDPQTEVARHVALLTGELAEGALHADGGPHGADGIVLACAGHAE